MCYLPRITEKNVRVQPEPTSNGVWMFRPIFLNVLYQTIILLEMDRLGYRGIKRVFRIDKGDGGGGGEKICQFYTFVPMLINLEIWYRTIYLIIYCILQL